MKRITSPFTREDTMRQNDRSRLGLLPAEAGGRSSQSADVRLFSVPVPTGVSVLFVLIRSFVSCWYFLPLDSEVPGLFFIFLFASGCCSRWLWSKRLNVPRPWFPRDAQTGRAFYTNGVQRETTGEFTARRTSGRQDVGDRAAGQRSCWSSERRLCCECVNHKAVLCLQHLKRLLFLRLMEGTGWVYTFHPHLEKNNSFF